LFMWLDSDAEVVFLVKLPNQRLINTLSL